MTLSVQDVELDFKRHKEGETDNLLDVEGGHHGDSSYERQQRAVVDSHPGHCLTVHQIQHIERDQEVLFPPQPGHQR